MPLDPNRYIDIKNTPQLYYESQKDALVFLL